MCGGVGEGVPNCERVGHLSPPKHHSCSFTSHFHLWLTKLWYLARNHCLLGVLKALQTICCRIAIACSQVLIGHVRTQRTHSGCPFIPGLPQEVLALPGPSCTLCPKDVLELSQDVHSAGNPQVPSPCCPKCPWDILADTTRMSIQQANLCTLS